METPPELSGATNRIWFHQSDSLVLVICAFSSQIQMVLYYLSICLSTVNDSLIHCDRFPFLLTR